RRRGLPGYKTHHRLLHMSFHVRGRGLFGISTYLTDHDDGVRVRVVIEQSQHVQEVGADDGIAADADAGGLADTQFGQLAYRFISQGARARNHADVAVQMDAPGHDTDLALARRDNSRTVRSDQAGLPALQELPGVDHVQCWNPFGDAN